MARDLFSSKDTKDSAWRLHLSITSISARTSIIPHHMVDFMVKLPSHMESMWRWWTDYPKLSGSSLSILCEGCTSSQACILSCVLVVFAYECSSTAKALLKLLLLKVTWPRLVCNHRSQAWLCSVLMCAAHPASVCTRRWAKPSHGVHVLHNYVTVCRSLQFQNNGISFPKQFPCHEDSKPQFRATVFSEPHELQEHNIVWLHICLTYLLSVCKCEIV